MVRCKSNSRLSSIVLTQTDTTVGFLSLNADVLYDIKERDINKQFIKVYADLKTFSSTNRVPNKFKNIVRRAKKTTYILKTQAFRIAKSNLNSQILRTLTSSYSTSANKSKESFNRDFCEDKADIIIEDKNSLFESTSSSLIKLNNSKKRKLR